MSILHRILIIIIGAVTATLLQTVVLLFVTRFITPSRNLSGFGGGIVIIVIFITALCALGYSIALSFLDSLSLSLVCSFIFSIWMSWGNFQDVIEIYQRPDYFDRDFFVSDIIQICANFIIYPLIAVIIWKLKTQYFFRND